MVERVPLAPPSVHRQEDGCPLPLFFVPVWARLQVLKWSGWRGPVSQVSSQKQGADSCATYEPETLSRNSRRSIRASGRSAGRLATFPRAGAGGRHIS